MGNTLTIVLAAVSGLVVLLLGIWGLSYAINKYGLVRRSNKLLKAKINSQGGMRALRESSKAKHISGR